MTTDILTILEMAVDGAGLLICAASVLLVFRSRRRYGRQAASPQPRPTDFYSIMDHRRIGQEAENVFSVLFAAVDGQRQRFMTALDGGGSSPLPEKRAVPVADASPTDRAVHAPGGNLSPAAMALARKIQQRQKDCRRN